MSRLKVEDQGLRESLQDLLIEGPEHAQVIEKELLRRLQGQPCDALSTFRAFHTLKGIFGFMGFSVMEALAHKAETLMEPYKREGEPSGAEAAQLLEACDRIRQQLALLAQGLPQGEVELLEEDAAAAGAPGEAEQDTLLRIPVAKMDALLEAVGELSVSQSQLLGGIRMGLDKDWLEDRAGRLSQSVKRLQDATLRLRMVPIAPIFQRLSRHAHELSKRLAKPLRLEMEGGDTEIDKGVAEELAEPLIHLVRNALDHGLESPEARRAAGKPEAGLLKVSARHQGGEFVLELVDDGRGLDLARLEARGRELGFLQAHETPDPSRLAQLLFEPGFSTAEKITELSGRGLGLEAVRKGVQALKGSVRASGALGVGCCFSVRLPLTLALMEAVILKSGQDRYLLPTAQVRRFLDSKKTTIHRQGKNAWVECGGLSLPLLDLRGTAGPQRSLSLQGEGVMVHIECAGHEAAILAEAVLDKQQVVAKSLGPMLNRLGRYTGGAVLQDGSLGLILDLESLLFPSYGADHAEQHREGNQEIPQLQA